MPVFQTPMARLRAWFSLTDDVTFTVRTSARIAKSIMPVVGKLTRDDWDGETYRWAVALWARWETPPLTLYQGEISLCRIHGPLLACSNGYRPAGGRVETTGFEANLTSEDAYQLDQCLRQAIERTIRRWAEERQGYANQNEPQPIDDATSPALQVASPLGRTRTGKREVPAESLAHPLSRLPGRGGDDA